jgi:hypothetical protein
MGFLLHGVKFRVLEKKLTNSGPFMESTSKHSIYTPILVLPVSDRLAQQCPPSA